MQLTIKKRGLGGQIQSLIRTVLSVISLIVIVAEQEPKVNFFVRQLTLGKIPVALSEVFGL